MSKLQRKPTAPPIAPQTKGAANRRVKEEAKAGDDLSTQKLEITISWGTIFKVLLSMLLTVSLVQLSRLFADFFLALLIGITLRPINIWIRKRKWPAWIGPCCTTLILIGAIALFVGLLVPTVTRQGAALVEALPAFKSELLKHIPAHGAIHNFAEEIVGSPSFSDPKPLLEKVMAFGSIALKGVVEFLIIMITAIYLLADGERVFRWLLVFLPPKHRRKVRVASAEVAEVVSAYMAGQLITSLLCGGYAFCILTLFHVPNAALLAVLAGMLDVLPLIGFFLALLPALASAATVSSTAAIFIGVLYGAYHLFENYFIVPRVYGQRLRLSALTVLVCCMVAGVVAGVIGILLVLPIVASYPIIERIWLQPHLEPDTVAKHEEIDGV